jgi:transposase
MARRAELFVRELSDGEAAHLLTLARRSRNPTVQHRAMLLFASFQRQSVSQIALMFQASATHVAELIHAFNAEGFACLDPRRGGGRPRRIDPDQRAEIVKVALARPADLAEPFTSWSLAKLRAYLITKGVVASISRSQLWRILRERGIRFVHHKTWKASPDPDFEAKKNRVLDLYAHPPEGARVLCLDEFGPLKLQPRLGRGWHPSRHPARFRATYKRTQGVRHLLAAYDPASGRLWGHIRASKTWREVRELLRTLRARFDEHLVVVLDNFSPHHKVELRHWAEAHDIELVYLPTYASWLNLIECQFQALRRFALNGTDYASHGEQDAAIHSYLRWHNRNSRPAKPWRINAEVHHSLPDVAA